MSADDCVIAMTIWQDTEEPARTERALGRFFTWRCVRFADLCPGDAFSQLPTWLADSSGRGRSGIWYVQL